MQGPQLDRVVGMDGPLVVRTLIVGTNGKFVMDPLPVVKHTMLQPANTSFFVSGQRMSGPLFLLP